MPFYSQKQIGGKMVEHYKIKLKSGANLIRFEKYLKELEIEFKKIEYFSEYIIYKIEKVSDELKEKILECQDVKRVLPMYRYFLDFKTKVVENEKLNIFTGDKNINSPIVGIIDNGVERLDIFDSWLYEDGKNYCKEKKSCTHGTFVAGVILQNVQEGKLKIYDGGIVPDFNIVQLEEDELLFALKKLVEEHPFIKVWNLAISIRVSVSQEYISDFGVLLDYLQDKYNILIVKSAGNGEFKSNVDEKNLILQGADSARALVVTSCNRENKISSFSLTGKSHNILAKPDIATYGGDVTFTEDKKIKVEGVLSLSNKNEVVSSFGTSFATARVTGLIGKILTLDNTLSPLFLKAFLIYLAKEPQKYLLGYGYLSQDLEIEREFRDIYSIQGEVEEVEKFEITFNNHSLTMALACEIGIDYNEDSYIFSDLDIKLFFEGKELESEFEKNQEFNGVKKYRFNFEKENGKVEVLVYRREKQKKNRDIQKMKFCMILKNEK